MFPGVRTFKTSVIKAHREAPPEDAATWKSLDCLGAYEYDHTLADVRCAARTLELKLCDNNQARLPPMSIISHLSVRHPFTSLHLIMSVPKPLEWWQGLARGLATIGTQYLRLQVRCPDQFIKEWVDAMGCLEVTSLIAVRVVLERNEHALELSYPNLEAAVKVIDVATRLPRVRCASVSAETSQVWRGVKRENGVNKVQILEKEAGEELMREILTELQLD